MIAYVVAAISLLSHGQLFLTPWTVAHQASLPMGFPKQEYQSGLPFPSPGDLPDTEIKPASLALTGRFFTPGPPGKPCDYSESEITQPCLTLCYPMDYSQQAPASMGFSRQEYWSGLPFPSPGDLPNPGIEPGSPALQTDASPYKPPGKPKSGWLQWAHSNHPG